MSVPQTVQKSIELSYNYHTYKVYIILIVKDNQTLLEN